MLRWACAKGVRTQDVTRIGPSEKLRERRFKSRWRECLSFYVNGQEKQGPRNGGSGGKRSEADDG